MSLAYCPVTTFLLEGILHDHHPTFFLPSSVCPSVVVCLSSSVARLLLAVFSFLSVVVSQSVVLFLDCLFFSFLLSHRLSSPSSVIPVAIIIDINIAVTAIGGVARDLLLAAIYILQLSAQPSRGGHDTHQRQTMTRLRLLWPLLCGGT